MTQPPKKAPVPIELEYAPPASRSVRRGLRPAWRTALFNVVATPGLALVLIFGGDRPDQITIKCGVALGILFLVSYGVLFLDVLLIAPRRNIAVPLWISAWTIIVGLITLLFLLGFLSFLAVL
jgi:hypothetical protein